MRKKNALPIGYSDVQLVIETGCYVDKTRYTQELIEKRNPIFIAMQMHMYSESSSS